MAHSKKKRRKHQVRAVNPGPAVSVSFKPKTCYDQNIQKLKSKLLK